MAYRGADSVAISLAIAIHDSVEVSVATGGSSLPLQSRGRYQINMQWDPSVWFDSVDFLGDQPAAWEDSIRSALPRSVSLVMESRALRLRPRPHLAWS